MNKDQLLAKLETLEKQKAGLLEVIALKDESYQSIKDHVLTQESDFNSVTRKYEDLREVMRSMRERRFPLLSGYSMRKRAKEVLSD